MSVRADPVVTISKGALRGVVEEGIASFRNVPYASPPVGRLRFLAPETPARWDGVRDASAYGPIAPQAGLFGAPPGDHPHEGDDFLNLNVFSPDPETSGLPVLVWIHGGGFIAGAAEGPATRGARFARDGVCFVSFHYRLGAEGFLEMRGAPSNRAFLDWLAALRWVQDEIASFGGDPSNVTIMGESAGSGACGHLLCEPAASGLFHRAICMSGVADAVMPPASAVDLGERVAAHLGCSATREDLSRFEPHAILDAHATVAANPFDPAGLLAGPDPAEAALKPFLDGDVITVDPREAFASDRRSGVELLAGSTTEEMNGLVKFQRAGIDDERARQAFTAMGVDADAYRAALGVPDLVTALEQAVTDRTFRGPLAHWLDARTDPTYAYQFAWRSPVGVVGAGHALDLAFAFDSLDAQEPDPIAAAFGERSMRGSDPPQSVADDMHGAFVRFATDGDPGWPPYDRERRPTMVFDVGSAIVDDPLRIARTFFGL